MNILSHKNINLHSASSEGGLIHIAAGASRVVPDDVTDHPGFAILLKAGDIVKIQDPEPEPEPKAESEPKSKSNKESK